MDKETMILESILLLQDEGKKPARLPLWHYVLDYTLTAIYLALYGFGIFTIIRLIVWA